LRHEVELLKFNLEVVLEKCRAQEAELRALRGQVASQKSAQNERERLAEIETVYRNELVANIKRKEREAENAARNKASDSAKEIDAALKAFREAPDNEAQRRAAERLEGALKKLRQQLQPKVQPDKVQPD
jgi:hypothetical protein